MKIQICRLKLHAGVGSAHDEQQVFFFSTNSACESHLLKHRAVILVSPDENLCDGADGLHKKISVVVCNCGVFGEDMVHIPAGKSTKYGDNFLVKGCSQS